MKRFWTLIVGAVLLAGVNTASATTLVEEFNDPFPAWENGWLGSNSNLQNYYGVGAGRGNQPNGLWVEDAIDDGRVDVAFNAGFGSLLTSLSLDVATFVENTLTIYDVSSNVLGTFTGFQTSSFDQAVNFSVTSSNGIGGFRFSSLGTNGNTWIDNVTVNSSIAPVPLPAGLPMLVAGIGLFGILRRQPRTV